MQVSTSVMQEARNFIKNEKARKKKKMKKKKKKKKRENTASISYVQYERRVL